MTASVGFHLKLHPERDADLLAAIDSAEDKSARWRELARKGLAVERSTAIDNKSVERSTILTPLSVLRRTESVERSTSDLQTPPNGFEPKEIEEAAKSLPVPGEATRLFNRVPPGEMSPAEIIRQRKAEAAAKLARPNPEKNSE
jgi:hypothetical protein